MPQAAGLGRLAVALTLSAAFSWLGCRGQSTSAASSEGNTAAAPPQVTQAAASMTAAAHGSWQSVATLHVGADYE